MVSSNRRVLFVDDDPLILRGYKRASEEIFEEWDVFFTPSGKDALTVLEQYPIDVIVTAIRMAGMDGIELLEQVRQLFPSTIRLALSGNVEDFRALKISRLAHQFLAKPCDLEHLKVVVERSCRLRDVLSDPQLISITTGTNRLPSLPSLYTRLMKALQSEDSSPQAIGEIISQDVSMTAKILQLVNSAFFGMPGRVTNTQRAVSLLGINTIKALVLGINVFSEYEGYSNQYFSIEELWQHSLVVGNFARAIARNSGLNAQLQEDAQVAGMLHDIGRLLQLKIPNFFRRIKVANGKVQLASEYKEFGVSHAEMGAYLLAIWGLPETIIEAVAFHHLPARQAKAEFGLVSILHVANGLYYQVMPAANQASQPPLIDMDYLQQIKMVSHLQEWESLCRKLVNQTE
jgi:putative nucleotidyltransferase with HDIG domain